MRLPARTRFTLALCFLAACRREPDPPAPSTGPDWNALRAQTDTRLARGDSAGFRSLGPLLLQNAPGPDDAAAYVQVALNTAQAWRGGAYADPYPLLVRADSLMRAHPRAAELHAQAGERLAEEFLGVRLPWRAEAVLRRMPPPWTPAGSGVAAAVAGILSLRWEAIATLGLPAGAGDSTVRARLLDLVAAPGAPSAFVGADDEYVPQTPDEASYAEELASVTPGPFLLPLHGPSPAPSLPEGLPEDDYLAWEGAALTAAQHDAVVRLYRATEGRSGGIADAGALRDAGAPFRQPGGDDMQLELAVREGDVLLLSFWTRGYMSEDTSFSAPGSRDVVAVYPGRAEAPAVRRYAGEGALETALRDVTGDGRPDLLVSERSGSGGFLDVEIVDLTADRVVWSAHSLYQGGVVLIDADEDVAPEILWTRHAGRSPSRLLATLSDYRAAEGRFIPVARGATGGAYYPLSAGPFGLGPHVRLRSLETRARAVLDRASRGSAPSREELGFLLGEYYATLMEARQYGTAAEAMDQLGRALERLSPDPDRSLARAAALRHRLLATVRGRGAREGLRMARDPVLRRAVAPHPEVLLDFLNITSVAAMAAGDFDQAYRALLEEDTLVRDGSTAGAHHGNLAWYLRQVGALAESHDEAARALDAALAAGDGPGVVADMFHLASSALATGRMDEALDWASRATGLARGSGDREVAAAALAIGAEIALRRGLSDIALRLLDEAVLCMDNEAWETTRASLLLGYAQALDASGRVAHAEQAYRAAARTAAAAGSPDRVAALHGLSRLADRRGDAGAAVAYAESAFAAVVQGRLSIGAEPHKFSFLGDKEAVAERLFGLARRRGAEPAWLLDRVEQSKMQVFLDLYGAPGGVRDRRGIGGDLRAALRPGDLLLDYVVGDSVSFVFSVTRQDGVRVHDLRARRAEIRALVGQVHAHMDLRRGGALRAIRRDRPPRELRAALRRLYALLLADVPLPAGTRRLIVVPDGSVAGLPWPALLDGGGRPLVERMEVSQLPSVSLALDRMRQVRADAPGGRPRALVVGVLDGVPAERVRDAVGFAQGPAWTPRALPPLAGGAREARTIGRALTGMEVRYLLDPGSRRGMGSPAADPTPANVLASLPSATVVHFIAHGVFNARAPMRSVLFLQADSAGGTLAAADFLGRPLPELQLVVLSACQTGVSGTMPGGEPVGFVRGVLGAGAASVVLTEWEVDDAATADLFTAFYTHLRSDTRSGALRKAQLEVMRTRRHPFYWAGVTLHGDWRALDAALQAR